MKSIYSAPFLWFSLMIITSPYLLATDDNASIEHGLSEPQVTQILGPSNGSINLADKRVVFYRLGNVTFINGEAVDWEIQSEEAYQAHQIAQQQADAAWDAARERAKQLRIERGLALKKRKLSDQTFAIAPLKEQLLFWESFIRNYPEVDVQGQYLSVKAAYKVELAEEAEAKRTEERIRALETRIAENEKQNNSNHHHHHHRSYRRYSKHTECSTLFSTPWKYTYYNSYPNGAFRNSPRFTVSNQPIVSIQYSDNNRKCK